MNAAPEGGGCQAGEVQSHHHRVAGWARRRCRPCLPRPLIRTCTRASRGTGCAFDVVQKLCHIGIGGRQQRPMRAVRSETYVDSVAKRGTGIRVIGAFFGLCAPEARTSQGVVFSHFFKKCD